MLRSNREYIIRSIRVKNQKKRHNKDGHLANFLKRGEDTLLLNSNVEQISPDEDHRLQPTTN